MSKTVGEVSHLLRKANHHNRLANTWGISRRLYNCCGPTEVTIVNTMHQHVVGDDISIGRPIPNTNVYILDEDEKPLPVGSVGIMWAGGQCVSRGYIKLPWETSKRFKLDKFVNDGSITSKIQLQWEY
jgi:non-ribosomal peptide synthetase component F